MSFHSIVNKKLLIDYEKIYGVEAGMVLSSEQVKCLRNKNGASIAGSYCIELKEEIYVKNLKITDQEQLIKLLLHKKQINKIIGYLSQKYTVVPYKIYESKGKFKLEIIVGTRLKKFDKREKLKQKEESKKKKEIFYQHFY